MAFGPFGTPTTFYNNSNGYTAVPDGQIEPSTLNLDTNTFSSSSGLNVFAPSFSGGIGSLSASGGMASLTLSGNQGIIVTDTATTYTIPFAQIFVSCAISVNGTGASADAVGCGIANNGSNWIIAHDNRTAGHVTISIDIGGTENDLDSTGFSTPSAPWEIGFSLVGNQATAWFSTNGTTWNMIVTTNVSSLNDFTASGATSGWFSAIEADLASGSSTWSFSSLKGGGFGGVGIRDMRLVTYPDGRPYMRGATVYLVADVAGVSGGSIFDTSILIFTFSPLTSTLTPIGVLFTIRSPHVFNDEAMDVVYDTINNIERLMFVDFGSEPPSAVTGFYTSQTITTDDWLAGGYHTAPSASAVTVPTDNANWWDPSFMCTDWNYSTSTCSFWQLAHAGPTGSSHTHIDVSTSDPSANSWTEVLDDTSISGFEGTTTIRSATGPTGVAYTTCIAGGGSATKCYNQAGTSVGALDATPPSDTNNPPWPGIFCYANTCYYVTFDATLFGSIPESMGNFSVASAPRY
jgi:hypothetical protein